MNSKTIDAMKRFDDGSVMHNERGITMPNKGDIMEKFGNEGGLAKGLGKSKKKQSLAGGPGGPRRGPIARGHGSPMKRRRR
jgi:hypothetical protein